MIELKALVGEGVNGEIINGEPSFVFFQILELDGPVEELIFTFEDGEIKLTRDGDVIGKKTDFDPTTFKIEAIQIEKRIFKRLSDAIDFARKMKPKEIKFDFRANSPQHGNAGIEIVISEDSHTVFMKEYD